MRGFRIGAIVLLVLPLVGSWFGCANNDDAVSAVSDRVSQNGSGDHQPSASSAAHGQSSNLSDVLAAWDSGNKEMAVDQFLLIRWDDSSAFATMPNVTLSERDFMSLSSDEQTRIRKQLWPALKDLARYTLSTGDNAAVSGDTETAKAHYDAVVHLGEALSSPERSLLIQLFGKAIAEMAAGDKASSER